MKKIIVLLGAALLSVAAFAYDSDPITVNGNPITYTKTCYSVYSKFGEFFRSPTVKYVHVFNNSGQETETLSYTAKDSLVDKIDYKYNISHNLEAIEFYDSNNKILCKTTLEYDAQGQVIAESEYDSSDNLTGKTTWKYEGKKVTESFYNGEGALLTRKISTMNDKGTVSEVAIYYGDGSLDQIHRYTYADNGTLLSIEEFDETKTFRCKTVYKYQAVGSVQAVSEIQLYNNTNKLIERQIYKLDAKGNPTSINVYEVAEKFGSTVNELTSITAFSYKYN